MRNENAHYRAKRDLHDAQERHHSATVALSDFENLAVYEFRLKMTKKQIRLAPVNQGERETHLNRQLLESGEIVTQGKTFWSSSYAVGWRIRPYLEKQEERSARRIELARRNLEVLEKTCLQTTSHS